jgi:hypothetical protein
VLERRKEGAKVYYRVKDPRTFQLLETARQILTAQLEETQELLGGLAAGRPDAPPQHAGGG